MDFNDAPEEARFRAEARTWLEANVPAKAELEGLDEIAAAKLWQKRKYDAGWACLRWPKEYGCREASAIEQVIWNQEESRFSVPANIFTIGQGMAAPTLMAWADDAAKQRYLPKLASGEEIWCQLFSEPAGGSDLAALRTMAVRDGDEWVVNGQKIWTSGAHYSDYGILVVRTDPDVPKHKGLSYFYFTDVRIPDSQRLGEVGQGWQVALTTLMNERATIASGGGGMGAGFDLAYDIASKVNIDGQPAINDAAVRAKLANWYVQEAGLKYTSYRSLSAVSRGETPGPENSIGKLVAAPKTQDIASFCIDLLEMTGAVWDKEFSELNHIAQLSYMAAPGGRIAGGTDEIMANILAERVLGLPQEPRVDKGIPFREVPTG